MNKTLAIVITGAVLTFSAVTVGTMFNNTASNVSGVSDNVEESICGDSRENFEAEKSSGSLFQAYIIKEEAANNGCSWPSEVSLDYEPDECPSEWVVAC